MKEIEKIKMSDGKSIPVLGLGTYRLEESWRRLEDIFSDAFECGLNLIDTAQGYGNEKLIGRALHDIGARRKDYYIIAKLDDSCHERQKAMDAIEQTMENLRTDYIDVFLIHSPNSDVIKRRCNELGYDENKGWSELNAQAFEALEKYKVGNHIGSIGVSNFEIHHLMALRELSGQLPCMNQIKTTVGSISSQEELFDFCKRQRITVCGYSPLGKGNLLNIDSVRAVASHYKKSCAQVLLRYIYEKGFCQIVKSTDYGHMSEDTDIFDFELNDYDRSELDRLMLMHNWARVRDPDTGLKKGS